MFVLYGASGEPSEDENLRKCGGGRCRGWLGNDSHTVKRTVLTFHSDLEYPGNVMAQTKQYSRDDLVEEYDSDPMEKDDTELELERRLFGDPEGFRNNLKLRPKGGDAHQISSIQKLDSEGSEEEDGENFEGLDDSAVRTVDPLIKGHHG